MRLTPAVRRALLTAHIVASVGWLGAVATFLVLAIAGVTSGDPETVRAVYLAMEVLGWAVLLPLALASFVSGVLQSLTTKWGLLRHYWVVAKLLMSVFATAVLLAYTQTLGVLADRARESAPTVAGVEHLASASPVLHAGGALALLLIAALLSVYKPHGLTRYGWRKQSTQRARA